MSPKSTSAYSTATVKLNTEIREITKVIFTDLLTKDIHLVFFLVFCP